MIRETPFCSTKHRIAPCLWPRTPFKPTSINFVYQLFRKKGLLKTKSNSIKAHFSQRNLMVSDTRRCQQRRKAWPGPFAISPYHSTAHSRRSDSWKLREVKRGAKKIKTSEGEKGDRRSLAALPSPPLFFLRAASDYLNACNRLTIRTVWRL